LHQKIKKKKKIAMKSRRPELPWRRPVQEKRKVPKPGSPDREACPDEEKLTSNSAEKGNRHKSKKFASSKEDKVPRCDLAKKFCLMYKEKAARGKKRERNCREKTLKGKKKGKRKVGRRNA